MQLEYTSECWGGCEWTERGVASRGGGRVESTATRGTHSTTRRRRTATTEPDPLLLRRHQSTTGFLSASPAVLLDASASRACDDAAWSVYLPVSASVSRMSSAKTDKPIDMLFGKA